MFFKNSSLNKHLPILPVLILLLLWSETWANETSQFIIEVKNFEFVAPEDFNPKPGDIIIWKNLDIAPHTATALDKSWDSGPLKTGESWSIVITAGMNLEYFCRFHPMMKAALSGRKK